MAHTSVKSKKQPAARATAKRATRKTARRAPAQPTASEIESRKAVARTFFNPTAAAVARAAFLKRQNGDADHAG
jgi:hypothetical protein